MLQNIFWKNKKNTKLYFLYMFGSLNVWSLLCHTFPHFALFFPNLISQIILYTFCIIVVNNFCFPAQQVTFEWCLLSLLFCPLKPQLVEADGHPSWVWFCQRFLPVKRESFLSTVASCMLRTGDWTKEKFRCNLLVSLARKLFLNWLCVYELN